MPFYAFQTMTTPEGLMYYKDDICRGCEHGRLHADNCNTTTDILERKFESNYHEKHVISMTKTGKEKDNELTCVSFKQREIPPKSFPDDEWWERYYEQQKAKQQELKELAKKYESEKV